MDLQQMRYVLAVAETGGFTRAAERCHVVQSALSHQVARLERELGARLFDRTSRRVRLTAAGEAFLPAARQALEAAGRARAEVAAATGEIRGTLTLGSIPTVAAVDLPGLLRDYRLRHPQVRIRLRTGSSERMVEQVREGTLDAAFLGVPPGFPTHGVHSRELCRGRHVAVVAPEHPLAGEAEVDLRRLAAEVFVDFAEGSAARAQSDRAFAAAGLRREVAFEVSGVELMVRMVRHGLGVALLPGAFTAELHGVRRVALTDGPVRVERLVHSRFPPSPAAAAFLALLGTPDALLGTPDALLGTRDALLGTPDALSGTPDHRETPPAPGAVHRARPSDRKARPDMSVIHRTTLTPGKLELLTSWLPSRPWYRGGAGGPELAKAGGFRLDDPEGEVGIEFMAVTDTAGSHPVTYLVPLTYRGAPLDGAEHALVTTAEHGVLGRRWIYEGCQDPLLVAELTALFEGRTRAQHQSVSDTPDPDVHVSRTDDGPLPADFTVTGDEGEETVLTASDGTQLRVRRVLRPAAAGPAGEGTDEAGRVAGIWRTPDGGTGRGDFVVLRESPRG
jgi:DNA-binding transcriptional LysR family regulator